MRLVLAEVVRRRRLPDLDAQRHFEVVLVRGPDHKKPVPLASSDEATAAFLGQLREDLPATARAFVRTMFLPGADAGLIEWVSADMAAAPPAIAVDVAGDSHCAVRD